MRFISAHFFLFIAPWIPLASASEAWSPSLEASAGLVYEDALVLRESDVIVDNGDAAMQSEVSLGMEYTSSNRIDAALNYSLSRTDYRRSDAFDLQTQVLSGSTSIDAGRLNIQLRAYGAQADLNGTSYLTLNSLSPGVSTLLTPRVYIMGQLSAGEKTLAHDRSRDALQEQGLLRVYYMLDHLDHYVALDYRYIAEDAESDEFDYHGGRVGGRWVKKFTVWGYPVTLQLASEYYWQDYHRVASLREDTALEVSGELQIALGDHWFIRVGCDYFDQQSTEDDLRYEQGRVHFRVGAHL